MERLKEHIAQFYAYHGIEVVRSNAETCVVTLPPQFRDLSAFTADLWCEFNAVVDIAVSHGTMEATIRLDNAGQTKVMSSLPVITVVLVGAAATLSMVYMPALQILARINGTA